MVLETSTGPAVTGYATLIRCASAKTASISVPVQYGTSSSYDVADSFAITFTTVYVAHPAPATRLGQ
jgi:hypothetical protein